MTLTIFCLIARFAMTVASLVEERTGSEALSTLLEGNKIEARFDLTIPAVTFVLMHRGEEIDLGVGVAFFELYMTDFESAGINWILDLADDAVMTAAEYLEALREENRRLANEFQF
ncbi:MAG: hypothetical protein RIB45_02265 [Marivibrio sp.]|uniref:hypothetical protein n=1 Tax=Marivibrio sp. TaxID=2039719 RepID=UPI0032EEF432